MRKECLFNNIDTIKMLVTLFAILTTTLFIAAYYVVYLSTFIWIRIIAIAYMVILILFLYFEGKNTKQKIKISEKAIPEKKAHTKEYTGSDYRKVFHKRSCRFSDSIKEENLEESDLLSYFTKKKYKPCGLCHPDKK